MYGFDMAKDKKLGEALSRIQAIIEKRDQIHVIHTSDVSRQDRELLIGTGWLQEIIKGWYLLVRPDIRSGDSSGWFASYWDFLHLYLTHFYGREYCLSAEHSLDLHLGMTVVPRQIVVMASKGRGTPLKLPFDTSLFIYASKGQLPSEREVVRRLQVMSLPLALCKVSPTFFQFQPREAEIALKSIKSSEDLLRVIISNNFVRAAGRLVGAYRFLGNEKRADKLLKELNKVNMKMQEVNPFAHEKPLLVGSDSQSPYRARIFAMWQQYRLDVIEHFPEPPGLPVDIEGYIRQVEEQYTQDAYNSLSIEGYQVSRELIEKVRNAEWSPESHLEDRRERDALAARGYYEAYLSVKESLEKILKGVSPGEVVKADLSEWYRDLFSPCVAARIIEPSDLFGYRRHQVYIRNSRHTPFPTHALEEAMDAFFRCLIEEDHASVRAVLGHFIFVFIHPFMDGNGRIGRFLMNTMLGSGGYPWTIVHVEHRREYLDALEKASTEGDIVPFVRFLRKSLEMGRLDRNDSS